MIVRIMSWEIACSIAQFWCTQNIVDLDEDGHIEGIFGLSETASVWGRCFEVSKNDIFNGRVRVKDSYIVPMLFVDSITQANIYEATPAQQELVDELEGTIRSLEVKLRCLKAFAEGKSQPDIAAMISDILSEEGMEVFA